MSYSIRSWFWALINDQRIDRTRHTGQAEIYAKYKEAKARAQIWHRIVKIYVYKTPIVTKGNNAQEKGTYEKDDERRRTHRKEATVREECLLQKASTPKKSKAQWPVELPVNRRRYGRSNGGSKTGGGASGE